MNAKGILGKTRLGVGHRRRTQEKGALPTCWGKAAAGIEGSPGEESGVASANKRARDGSGGGGPNITDRDITRKERPRPGRLPQMQVCPEGQWRDGKRGIAWCCVLREVLDRDNRVCSLLCSRVLLVRMQGGVDRGLAQLPPGLVELPGHCDSEHVLGLLCAPGPDLLERALQLPGRSPRG